MYACIRMCACVNVYLFMYVHMCVIVRYACMYVFMYLFVYVRDCRKQILRRYCFALIFQKILK
jgi:hypothetical protein